MMARVLLMWVLLFCVFGCSTGQDRARLEPNESARFQRPKLFAGPVVFIGDSITAFFNLPGLGLAEWSRHPNWTNKGISGQTSGQVQARFETDVVDLKPAIVVILVGTNDVYPGWTPESSEANVEQMVEMASSAGIKVVLGTIPPWNCIDQTVCGLASLVDSTLSRYARIDEWNAWLKQYAADHGIVVADYWGGLVSDDQERYPTALTLDGVHPSAQGYVILASIAVAAIENTAMHGQS
jgi:lysophospholipase L1-like esterase